MSKKGITNKQLKIASKKINQKLMNELRKEKFPISYRIISGSLSLKTRKDTRIYQEQRYGKPINKFYRRKKINGKSTFVETTKTGKFKQK